MSGYELEDYVYRDEYSIEYIDSEFPIGELSEPMLYPPCDVGAAVDEHILSFTDAPLVVGIVDQIFAAVQHALDIAKENNIDPNDERAVYMYAHRAYADADMFANPNLYAWVKNYGQNFWLRVAAVERFFIKTVNYAILEGVWEDTEYNRLALTDTLIDPYEGMKQVYFEDLGLEV